MARTRRDVVVGYPHHVTARGNNRRRLFSYPPDYRRFITYLESALEAAPLRLHQVTLMTNHVHLVATPDAETALNDVMKRTCQRYAQYRNRARDTTGKLFEERFYSEPLLNEAQFIAALLYADSNAFRAGMVSAPQEHRWSTCALYSGIGESEIPVGIWTPADWYLEMGATNDARAREYRRLMQEMLPTPGGPSTVTLEMWSERVMQSEQLSAQRYTRRLERPNRKRAL